MTERWSYDRIAGEFDVLMNRYDLERRLDVVFGRLLQGVPLRGARLLDAGCGTGWFAARAAHEGARVVGLDLGADLLREARGKGVEALVAADAAAMPFADGTFDAVISSECIEHTPSPRETVRELVRVLRPGGVLALTCPNATWRWSCAVANAMGWRPYHGLENWPRWGDLRRWASENGLRIRDHVGVHIAPFVFAITHPILRRLDRFGDRFGRIYVNQCLAAEKPAAGP